MFKKLFFLFSIFIIALSSFLVFKFVLAQYGLEKFKAEDLPIVETQRSTPEVVGEVIKWILGIIGVILVVLIVYGGVTYMTAAGNEEQVKKARGVLTYSVVGVTVIAAAFLITNYVVTLLFPASVPPLPNMPGGGGYGEGATMISQGESLINQGESMIERGQRLIAQGNEEEGQRLIEQGESMRDQGQQLVDQGKQQEESEFAEYQRQQEEEAARRGEQQARQEEARRCNTACQRCGVFNAKCCAGFECRSDVEGGLSEWLPYGAVCVRSRTKSGEACCRPKGDICGPAQLGNCCSGLTCQDGKCATAPEATE